SHLRWDWVYQRPQHLLARLARDRGYRVCFVEEPYPPDPETSAPSWTLFPDVAPGVTRCVPRLDVAWPFFLDERGPDTRAMRCLLRKLVGERGIVRPVAWFYTPLAVPLLGEVAGRAGVRAVVHDCMDELALFKGA